MKKPMTEGEEFFAQILEECLEEDLSFIPPEREIARKHQFSEKFETSMESYFQQLENTKEKKRKKYFFSKYARFAACVFVLCVCSVVFYLQFQPFGNKKASEDFPSTDSGSSEDMLLEDAPEESQEEVSGIQEDGTGGIDTAVTEAAEDFSAEKEYQSEEGIENKAYNTERIYEKREYCGQTVYLAEQQEVPKFLDYVTTLINCPVQDEENPTLYLTIGNTGEETIYYLNQFDLEVWLEDGWYVILPQVALEEEQKELEAGMAVDEEINLENYKIGFGAQKYRLVAHINDELVSAEFRFSEVFSGKK